MGRQVAQALEEARRRGVVHRDIKPDNILQAGPNRYKVADFGIARWSGASVRTQDGVILGTPAYISPQQVRGLAPEHQSDLYALGVTLFELLTGRTPFFDANPLVLLEMHRTVPAPSVRELVPEVPPAFDAVVSRLLAKEREHRYDSASDVAAALAPLLDTGGSPRTSRTAAVLRPDTRPAAPTTRLGTPRRAVWPNWLAFGSVALGLAAVLAMTHREPDRPGLSRRASAVASIVPEPGASAAAELQAILSAVDRLSLKYRAAHELMPGEVVIDPSIGHTHCRPALEALNTINGSYLLLLRRAWRYPGLDPTRLPVLERLGFVALSDTGRVLRYTLTAEALTAAPPEFRSLRAEVLGTLGKLRQVIGGPPAAPVLKIVAISLGPQLSDTLDPPHLVLPATAQDASARAADALEAMTAIAPDTRTLPALAAQILLLDRVAFWWQPDRPGKMTLSLSAAGEAKRRPARLALFGLIEPFVSAFVRSPASSESVHMSKYALMSACVWEAADRQLERKVRVSALAGVCALIPLFPGGLAGLVDGAPAGTDFAARLRSAREDLGPAAMPACIR